MDSRFRPRTRTSRPPLQRPQVEREGNLVTLRFDKRPEPVRIPTTGWYHAEAVEKQTETYPL